MKDLTEQFNNLKEKYDELESIHKNVIVKYDEIQERFVEQDLFLLRLAITLQTNPDFKDTDVAKYVVDRIHYQRDQE